MAMANRFDYALDQTSKKCKCVTLRKEQRDAVLVSYPDLNVRNDDEASKKRAYERRILEVEHASFTPLIFSATGGLGREATAVYKRIAAQLSAKWGHSYSSTMAWIRCHLSFSLLRSSIMPLTTPLSAQVSSILLFTVYIMYSCNVITHMINIIRLQYNIMCIIL